MIRPGKKLVIVENEQSKRSTPSAISFSDQGREYGYNALKNQAKRADSTVLFIHNLLGSPDTDYFSRTFQPLGLIPNTDRNSTLVQIGKDLYETEEITAMILEHIKEMSEKFGEGGIKDCSITIPSFWTRAQKIAVISAANAAGLNVLALMHENTGAAFYYGIDRMDNITEHYALFYNLGASYLQVTLAKYGVASKKAAAGKQMENVEILAHAFDDTLGGSLFDSLIAKRLAEKFKEKHGTDLLEHPKAMVRVLAQANQAKKTLSANKNTLVQLNSIHKGIDFSYTLTRDEFEKLIEPYSERLTKPVLEVLEKAGIEAKEVNNFEIIGGVSRIPKVQEILKEKTGIDISTHLNGDESMAHGAAIYAANFSSVVQVKPMWLTDISITSFSAKFYSESDSNWNKEAVLFKEGSKLANKKKITFGYNKDLFVLIEEHRQGKVIPLCYYEIKGITELEKDDVSLYFSFVLDNSGIPFLHTADAKYERVIKKREDGEKLNLYDKNLQDSDQSQNAKVPEGENQEQTEKNENNENSESSENSQTTEQTETDSNSPSDASDSADSKEPSDSADSKDPSDSAQDSKSSDSSKEKSSEDPEDSSKGKKQRTVKLNFKETQLEQPIMLESKDVSKIIKRLESQKEAEVLAKKLAEAQNDLEGAIYTYAEKLDEDNFVRVTSPEEREELSTELSKLREWMESEAFKESSAYEVKKRKKELEGHFADPIQREKEHEVRERAVEKAFKELGRLEDALIKLNETKPWIPVEDSLLAWTRLNETLKWVENKVEEQKKLKDWEPLAFRTSELEIKVANVQKQVEKLKKMQKPKPKKGAAPDFINFGDNFDWSKVKMENVNVDGKEYNYDPDKKEEEVKENVENGSANERTGDEKNVESGGQAKDEL